MAKRRNKPARRDTHRSSARSRPRSSHSGSRYTRKQNSWLLPATLAAGVLALLGAAALALALLSGSPPPPPVTHTERPHPREAPGTDPGSPTPPDSGSEPQDRHEPVDPPKEVSSDIREYSIDNCFGSGGPIRVTIQSGDMVLWEHRPFKRYGGPLRMDKALYEDLSQLSATAELPGGTIPIRLEHGFQSNWIKLTVPPGINLSRVTVLLDTDDSDLPLITIGDMAFQSPEDPCRFTIYARANTTHDIRLGDRTVGQIKFKTLNNPVHLIDCSGLQWYTVRRVLYREFGQGRQRQDQESNRRQRPAHFRKSHLHMLPVAKGRIYFLEEAPSNKVLEGSDDYEIDCLEVTRDTD